MPQKDMLQYCNLISIKCYKNVTKNGDLGFAMERDGDTIIFTNTTARLSREIFTLAHEIGHVILHMGKDGSFVDDNITIFGRSEDEREQEANYFASCLLMPDDVVSKYFDFEFTEAQKKNLTASDIARIMSDFNVSFEMALNRLQNIGVIDANQKVLLDNEKNREKGWKFITKRWR